MPLGAPRCDRAHFTTGFSFFNYCQFKALPSKTDIAKKLTVPHDRQEERGEKRRKEREGGVAEREMVKMERGRRKKRQRECERKVEVEKLIWTRDYKSFTLAQAPSQCILAVFACRHLSTSQYLGDRIV